MLYLIVVLMGLVEGLTEFIPVSSTGHLILAGDLLGFNDRVGKDFADFFEIFIQLGAILAVVVAYPRRFTGLLDFRDNRGFSGLRGLALLFVTTVPGGLLGLALRSKIKEHLFYANTVAIGLAVGTIWILAVEWFVRRRAIAGGEGGSQQDREQKRTGLAGVNALDWFQAAAIGVFQSFALWPGMSRSSSTILGGMMVGADRKTATEYSFFAAVPMLVAATLYELYKSLQGQHFAQEQVTILVIGTIVSFFSAWAAVKFFISYLTRHTLVPFGWYRLAVAGLVLWFLFGKAVS